MASNRDAASDDGTICIGTLLIVLICWAVAMALVG